MLLLLYDVENRWPYNLYCVGADVKPCSINQSVEDLLWLSLQSSDEDFEGENCLHNVKIVALQQQSIDATE